MSTHGDGVGAGLGVHLLADILDVPDPAFFARDFLVGAFREALEAAGATIRRFVVEEFSPHDGLSILVVLAESHASLHTWPERGAILVDVFTCGPMTPQPVVDALAARLGGAQVKVVEINRGDA